MVAHRTPAFRGRTRERNVLDDALAGVRAGGGGVLVIRGEAGIGKTALLHYAAGKAAGCRIIQIAGVESELAMPFAALHQLCAPLLAHLGALPEPQAHAVRVAFGVADGIPPDRFIVGLAVLGLLAEASVERPIVCLVDDAQWLDETSSQVLGFVARRLLAEAVLLVVAARETGDEQTLRGLPTLTVGGLTDADARALLDATVRGHLDPRVRDRIVAEARGNPLGLLEFPKGMSPAELAGGFAIPATATVSDQLHARYLGRVRALPTPTRHLMLLAAADPTGDAALVWRAASTLGIGHEAAEAAGAEDLLEIGGGVRFRHPLVRSAAYLAGAPADRRAVHHALAQATDVEADPERRVWHLAGAAGGPDEHLALELERSAATAQARAGLPAAAAFLQRSMALTADPVRRADRAYAAALAHLRAGAFDAARDFAGEAAARAGDDLQRARAEQLAGQIEAAANPGREAPVRLLRAASRLQSLDVRLARDTYLQAWWAAVLAGQFAAPGGDLRTVCRAARAAPRPADARPSDLLLDGLATAILEDRAAAAPALRQAVELFREDRVSTDDWLQWGRSATTAAFALWDADGWAELSGRQVELARGSGALTSLVLSLNHHGFMTTHCGDLEAAAAVVAEHDAVKEATGIPMAAYGAHLLAAYQGRQAELTARMAALDTEAIDHGDGYALQIESLATAVLNNGLGRHQVAAAAAREVAADELSFLTPFALAELVEAVARDGDPAEGRTALKRLSGYLVEGSDWAMGLAARCEALLSEGRDAEQRYREAIERLGRTRLRPDLTRAHLLLGEWLRRENRRSEAKKHLQTAYAMSTAMGLGAFAERARRELRATGEKVRRRRPGVADELTPQEEHIARMARDGRTNAEIGAELFVSARTVEWHLRKVFVKLGIASRRELRQALSTAVRV
ncbi:AAA family ATPase [Actinoplanes sp. KI2]|uniref:AAA family ATPase n=1 Tax=Actinoplanes sp. KI2 TaxID=2983315 RepID=UPI0021D5F2AC|nr:LuxR family transcriptional regulator [Actinoplanes sp. KI2]MCU7730083.1 AAA family ATPase [Actinoplanes sp. KI2]